LMTWTYFFRFRTKTSFFLPISNCFGKRIPILYCFQWIIMLFYNFGEGFLSQLL